MNPIPSQNVMKICPQFSEWPSWQTYRHANSNDHISSVLRPQR